MAGIAVTKGEWGVRVDWGSVNKGLGHQGWGLGDDWDWDSSWNINWDWAWHGDWDSSWHGVWPVSKVVIFRFK